MSKLAARKPRLSREEQKAARARELLDAAWELFCEKGYESLSIDEVAEHAGYSRMPIYSLFGDKQNLFFEVWRSRTADILDALVENCKAGAPLMDNLRQLAYNIVNGRVRAASGYGEYLFFVVQTISLNRPDIRSKLKTLAAEHINALADLMTQSTLREGEQLRAEAHIIAKHLLAHINGMSAVVFLTETHFETEDELVDIFRAAALRP